MIPESEYIPQIGLDFLQRFPENELNECFEQLRKYFFFIQKSKFFKKFRLEVISKSQNSKSIRGFQLSSK